MASRSALNNEFRSTAIFAVGYTFVALKEWKRVVARATILPIDEFHTVKHRNMVLSLETWETWEHPRVGTPLIRSVCLFFWG